MIKWLSKKWRNISMQQKMMLLFSACAIVPIIVVAGISMTTTSSHLEESVERQVEQSAYLLNSNMNLVFEDAMSSLYFGKSIEVSNFLSATTADELYSGGKTMGAMIKNWRAIQQPGVAISDLTVVSVLGHGYSERMGFFRLPKGFYEYEMFKDLVATPRALHFWGSPDVIRGRAWEGNVISLGTAIFKYSTNEVAGFIRISYDKDFMADLFSASQISKNGHSMVMDASGVPVLTESGMNPAFSGEVIDRILAAAGKQGLFYDKVDSVSSLVVYSPLSATGWTMVTSVPTAEVLRPVQDIRSTAIAAVLVSIAFVFFFVYIISSNISRPIKQLSAMMGQAAGGDFNIEVPDQQQTEIRLLYQNFDMMVREIEKLMDRVIVEQDNLKRSELKALQEQINPHFLYNSMDSAVWAAESGNTDQVVNLLISLSNFYKLTLSGGVDVVPLRTELAQVRSYLEVVQMRYRDLLNYSFETDAQALAIRFPKIILQPLVENAVYHGIKNKRYGEGEKGHVVIRTAVEDGMLVISVADNGIGLSEAAMRQVRVAITTQPVSTDSYGLKNVDQRIKLFFGAQYGLALDSVEGEGTRVTIRVPKIEEQVELLEGEEGL